MALTNGQAGPRILWLPNKQSDDAAKLEEARKLLRPGATLLDQPDDWWTGLRATAGGWAGIPAACARLFDAALVCPSTAYALGRGQHSFASAFLSADKRVGWLAYHESRYQIWTVRKLDLSSEAAGEADWKLDYSRPVFAEDD